MPEITMLPMITLRKTHLVFIDEITIVNSTLNPSLYCWRIREVRQAVKQTIRNVLCCPWSQIFPWAEVTSESWFARAHSLPDKTTGSSAETINDLAIRARRNCISIICLSIHFIGGKLGYLSSGGVDISAWEQF